MESQEIFNVWAVGRNYSEHAQEMNAPRPDSPVIFLKAGSSVTKHNKINLPVWANDVHHEIEIALKFDKDLKISAWTLALDLTERTLQSELKKKSLPWTLSKSFPESCPIGPLVNLNNLKEIDSLNFELKVNHQSRQRGLTKQMTFSPSYLVDYVLKHFPVKPGDLLLTGTPSGVGPLKSGDHLQALVNDAPFFEWWIS